MLHPKSPEPIYRMADGRFLLFFHNHDGHAYGATGPWDMEARHPLFVSVGEFRPGAHQPIWFSRPRLLCDTEFVGVGLAGLTWLAMYAGYTESNGKRIFWYPDRKHFLLGTSRMRRLATCLCLSRSLRRHGFAFSRPRCE